MTARFLVLYETPADPEASGRHYRETHIPLGRRLPRLRRYAVSRDAAAVRGALTYRAESSERALGQLGDFRRRVRCPDRDHGIGDRVPRRPATDIPDG